MKWLSTIGFIAPELADACHHNRLFKIQSDFRIVIVKLPDNLNFLATITTSRNSQDGQSKQVIKLHPKLP